MSLSKKSKIVLGILFIGIVAAVFVYQYSMQPPAQIEDKKVEFTGTSTELLSNVQQNAEEWQDKVVVISGKITSVGEKGFILSSQIFCQLKDSTTIKTFSTNQEISIKGRVIGYDDLLEELKLDQCIIQ